jgi:predicted transcriptional regulator YdeE
MNVIQIPAFTLIGLALKTKTTNANNQAATDCGNLWQQFEKENYVANIPGKTGDEIFAVYHDYEGDHTQPYAYFIGCKVNAGTAAPDGMDTLTIAEGKYQKIEAKGIMPDCVANAWREIWAQDTPRTYVADYEVYDDRSKDWANATVDIYLGVK